MFEIYVLFSPIVTIMKLEFIAYSVGIVLGIGILLMSNTTTIDPHPNRVRLQTMTDLNFYCGKMTTANYSVSRPQLNCESEYCDSGPSKILCKNIAIHKNKSPVWDCIGHKMDEGHKLSYYEINCEDYYLNGIDDYIFDGSCYITYGIHREYTDNDQKSAESTWNILSNTITKIIRGPIVMSMYIIDLIEIVLYAMYIIPVTLIGAILSLIGMVPVIIIIGIICSTYSYLNSIMKLIALPLSCIRYLSKPNRVKKKSDRRNRRNHQPPEAQKFRFVWSFN